MGRHAGKQFGDVTSSQQMSYLPAIPRATVVETGAQKELHKDSAGSTHSHPKLQVTQVKLIKCGTRKEGSLARMGNAL